ncbi:MAG: 2-C-methyl-D-erythritol 4-phosphate cytidylyltransferase [Acidimicrobiales bacterium]
MSVWAVIVAAGQGARFGSLKQYERLEGRRVVDWSIDAARAACDHVVLVVPEPHSGEPETSVDAVVAGGPTRSASVRAGLAAVPEDAELIVVHDAARPRASPQLFRSVIDAVRAGADGAVPGLPVVDTIKRVDRQSQMVIETPDRAALVAVQTPQAFRASILRAAHRTGGEATDDASLVERCGGRIVVVPGEAENRKVTDRHDLDVLSDLRR